jgi:hypothetical protein
MRYELRRPGPSVLAAALIVATASPVADAASRKTGASRPPPPATETAFRCRDAEGRAQLAQSIPEPCLEQDVEVLDATGRVVRVIPGRQALERAAEQRASEEAAKQAAQRDKVLLATYLSVADIERLRDQRIGLLEQQSHVTKQYIANLREREARLMTDVQRYRPYSDKPKAPPLPDHVAEDIVNTVNGLQVYEQQLAKNTVDRDRLRADFDSDITRFKELQGIR